MQTSDVLTRIGLVVRRGGWQRPLDDLSEVVVYAPSHEIMAVLPGALVVELVRQHLHAARLVAVTAAGAATPRQPLARIPADALPPMGPRLQGVNGRRLRGR